MERCCPLGPLLYSARDNPRKNADGKKNEVLGLRSNAETADRGGAAICVHMDTSHYQRLRVIEITFFLCKLNVASGSFANCECVPPPPPHRLAKFK